MTVVSVQPAGPPAGRLPYPYHVGPDGKIGRQEFWRGDPAELIGFAKRLDVHRVDLDLDHFLKNPTKAVGMYAVLGDAEGNWRTDGAPVESVSIHESGKDNPSG